MKITYSYKERVCTIIYADANAKTVRFMNFAKDPGNLAFGIKKEATWDDLMKFLERRCIPKSVDHLDLYLKQIGVSSYDPIEIIKVTKGKRSEDDFWVEISET